MPHNRQGGIRICAVAVPDHIEPGAAMGSGEGAQTRRSLRLKPPLPRSVSIPGRRHRHAVAAFRRR